jgi:hypothetical protein
VRKSKNKMSQERRRLDLVKIGISGDSARKRKRKEKIRKERCEKNRVWKR